MKIDFNTGELSSPKAQELLEHLLGNAFNKYYDLYSRCESPIEQIMALELECVLSDDYQITNHIIIPQSQVKLNEKTYRADFEIRVWGISDPCRCAPGAPVKEYFVKLFIECDGHDFHEKTKEQARRDKTRDRAFAHNNLTILHFTGSEIFKDSAKCAQEVYELICKRLDENG